MPGECSFLQSPSDLQVPSRPPVWRKLSCWQCRVPELWVFSALPFRWWAVFSWHRNIGREGLPRPRSWHEETPCCREHSAVTAIRLPGRCTPRRGRACSGTRRAVPRPCRCPGTVALSRRHLVFFLFRERQGPRKREGQVLEVATASQTEPATGLELPLPKIGLTGHRARRLPWEWI